MASTIYYVYITLDVISLLNEALEVLIDTLNINFIIMSLPLYLES